jgi:hypothetical protein
MQRDAITSRALQLAEEFLAGARVELLELAHDDLDQLRASAAELRTATSDHTTTGRSTEHVAYVALATAFNQALARRNGRARSGP